MNILDLLSEKTEFTCDLDTSASTNSGYECITLELSPTRSFSPRSGRVWTIILRTNRGSLAFKYAEDMEIFLSTCCSGLKMLGTDYYSIAGYRPLNTDNPPDLHTILRFLVEFTIVSTPNMPASILIEKLRLAEGLRQIYSSWDLDDLRLQICG